jgi:putative SOS response-associated peptidase YedK
LQEHAGRIHVLSQPINARAETVADKPMFRDAFARHRCVIPASGYYEWLKRADGRQPYFISPADGGVLSFAGLWDRWKNSETGEQEISCTIIVTDANELTRPIHDRMPVVLDIADIRPWMSGEVGTEVLSQPRKIAFVCAGTGCAPPRKPGSRRVEAPHRQARGRCRGWRR